MGSLKIYMIGMMIAFLSSFAGAEKDTKAAEAKKLNIYNWSDYIAKDTIKNFEKETGIKVNYDVFDSNEVLETKLLAGKTGFDLVVPSLSFLARQIKAGVFMPLDKSLLTNYKHLDPLIMKQVVELDPGNTHAVPYLWGTTGIGFNKEKVVKALGKEAPLDSWDLVMKPENLKKLKSCGVGFLNAPTEMIPSALHYLGEEPNSFDKKIIQKGIEHLKTLRPHITYFHSSQYINDLANGDICVAIGWSGDILQAADRAEEAKNNVNVSYVIPKEGAGMWFDMLAIPKDAKHPENAHRFINYLLRPEVIAEISNYVQFANGNAASKSKIDKAILDNKGIYPSSETANKLYTFPVLPRPVERLYNRGWTSIKTGK